jgi:hypothetical protein
LSSERLDLRLYGLREVNYSTTSPATTEDDDRKEGSRQQGGIDAIAKKHGSNQKEGGQKDTAVLQANRQVNPPVAGSP